MLTKQETSWGRGAREESSRSGNPGGLLSHAARSLGLHGDRVCSRAVFGWSSFSACIWSDSGPFLVAHTSLIQDGFQREGFWEVGRAYSGLASPPSFDPSQILPAAAALAC